MRYQKIDEIRGITLISMMFYHGIWNMVYIFNRDFPWFRGAGAYMWQQSICWTFILLSGFCWPLGKKKLKRGMTVLLGGFLISAVTVAVMPEQRIVFGILTLLGSCMLWMIPAEKVFQKVNAFAGLAVSVFLFVLFRNVNRGYLGFEGWNICRLPKNWYGSCITTYLGFTEDSFYSADYFSLLPWLFLFVTGYFLYRIMKEKNKMEWLIKIKRRNPILEIVGKNSLMIYMLHQPVIYGVLWLCRKLFA